MANTRETLGEQATLDGLVQDTLVDFEEDGITSLPQYGIYRKSTLQNLTLPSVTSLANGSISYCSNLQKIDLSGSQTVAINSGALSTGNQNLNALILRSTAMSTMSSTGGLANTKIAIDEGAVYVPTNLVATYKANANWKQYFIADIADYPVTNFETISDSWADIFEAEDDGTYLSKYAIGDTKTIDLGTEGTLLMEIVAFDQDDLADESGKAHITWISKRLLNTKHNMNSSSTTSGGWASSSMRTYLRETIKPLIPTVVRNRIKEVTKISATYENSAIVVDGQTTTDDVWIPSNHEIFNVTTYESTGAVYSSKFTDASSRIKYDSTATATYWWLRSASSGTYFRIVYGGGTANDNIASRSYGVALGFCT